MNYSDTLASLSQVDLQHVSGGASIPVFAPGCILYAPGYGPNGPIVPPVSVALYL